MALKLKVLGVTDGHAPPQSRKPLSKVRPYRMSRPTCRPAK